MYIIDIFTIYVSGQDVVLCVLSIKVNWGNVFKI